METTSSFGYWIRRQRKALDLTQQALADRVGCSVAAIKKIEGDERKPSRQIAERLADVLGVPASQRQSFLEVARGLRSVDQLSLEREPAIPSRPSGTVTFLFTDIEDSTKLAQEHPEEWETLRARHHVILRETIEADHGHIFQVIGDAFCASFHTPNDGLRAAIEAQRKLQSENWGGASLKVRMGIHTGEAETHRNEYRGYLTLSLVERLVSAGHGGQILLSDATKNVLSGHLPNDVSLLDLGEHNFKNVLQPVRVFQVIAPDLQKEFPTLHTQDVLLNNLPIQLTSFIGREKEIADVIRLLEKARLVTLTGPGGTGKTRLSTQVANQLLDQYPDGVWMVELAPILDPLLLPRTTAIAIGLRDEPHRPVIDMLCDYLREKKLLLLLDNCEHLIEACAQLTDMLLHACSQIRILATSREALGIAGETLYLVPSLTLPDIQYPPPLESLHQFEAIKLFVDRAASAIPTFTLMDENASSIAEICQRLDGIPLAIELAAGKIRALSPGQIAKRLDDRFHLLTGGSRTALPRHKTLHAAIEWSYDLLSPSEQTLFRRLSVFVNGWMLEAAESVCSDEDTTAKDALKAGDILELLTQLVSKSLVMTEERSGEVRYHMLETIRQFAREQLDEIGESDTLCDNHLDYFLHRAEIAAPHLIRSEQLEWLAQLDTNYENMRSALKWALSKETAEVSLRLCAALGTFWNIRCYWLEGSKWLNRALSKTVQNSTPAEKAARVKALYQDAELAERLDDLERIKSSAELSLTLAQEGSDQRDIAIARYEVAHVLYRRGEYEKALPLLEQCYTGFQELNDAYWQLNSYKTLSRILIMQDRLSFHERTRQVLELARKGGERLHLAQALFEYAERFYLLNQLDEALKYAEEADTLFKQVGSNMSRTSSVFAEFAWINGNYKEAKSYFMEMQERFGLMGDKNIRSSMIENLGLLTMEQGDLEQAQMYFEEALTMAREINEKVSTAIRLAELGITYYLQGNIARCKQYFREGITAGKGLGRYRRNTNIHILIYMIYYINTQKSETSVNIQGAIANSQKENERPLTPLMKHYYDRTLARARDALGGTAFESAFAKGQKMSLDEALDLALKTVEEL